MRETIAHPSPPPDRTNPAFPPRSWRFCHPWKGREGSGTVASGCALLAQGVGGESRCAIRRALGAESAREATGALGSRQKAGGPDAGRGCQRAAPAGVRPGAAAAHLPRGRGGARCRGAPPPAARLPPGEEVEGRGVNRAAAVMSAGHMEPLMARDGSRRAGSCCSCCCGSGGGGAAAAEGAPGSDHPLSLRSPHRGLNDVFCDRSDER